MTRTEIRDHFSRHRRRDQIDRALDVLEEHELAHLSREKTDGRPVERWIVSPEHATKAI